jgi:hypothetical protein
MLITVSQDSKSQIRPEVYFFDLLIPGLTCDAVNVPLIVSPYLYNKLYKI